MKIFEGQNDDFAKMIRSDHMTQQGMQGRKLQIFQNFPDDVVMTSDVLICKKILGTDTLSISQKLWNDYVG